MLVRLVELYIGAWPPRQTEVGVDYLARYEVGEMEVHRCTGIQGDM